MKVCFISEGSYPYVQGGVSNWVQSLIENFPEIEFSVLSISTSKKDVGEYKFKIPGNVMEIKDIFLNEPSEIDEKKKIRLSKLEKNVLADFILNSPEDIDWLSAIKFLTKYRNLWEKLLVGKDFFDIAVRFYNTKYTRTPFANFLWTLRSMYMPLFASIINDIPQADIYHSVSTGYAGLLGAIAKNLYNKPLLLTEHGIYTREREEEIIKSDWVKGVYKDIWIDQFNKLSKIAYQSADKIITLFEDNKRIQIELGCPPEKIEIIPNGINIEKYPMPSKLWDKAPGALNIGAIVRVVPIKDIKTMILAFDTVKASVPGAKLWIIGPYEEDPEYYEECRKLIDSLGVTDIVFTGYVKVQEYIANMDIMLLTSISEGQPLGILEGMAYSKPHVCTNVGGCKELIVGGSGDNFKEAGLVVPIMNVQKISKAIILLNKYPVLCEKLGMAGRKRVENFYRQDIFLKRYHEIYSQLGGD